MAPWQQHLHSTPYLFLLVQTHRLRQRRMMQELRDLVASAQQGRPWGEFMESGRFQLPTNTTVALERMRANLHYYRANYQALFLVALVCSCIVNNSLAGWIAISMVALPFIKEHHPEYTSVGTYLTRFIAFYIGGSELRKLLFAWIVVVCGHAAMRRRSLKSKAALDLRSLWSFFDPVREQAHQPGNNGH